MIVEMLILTLCWLVGYGISALLAWYLSPKSFPFRNLIPELVLSIVLGIVASFFVAKISLNGWLVWLVFIFCGFISETIIKFIASKGRQINGEE